MTLLLGGCGGTAATKGPAVYAQLHPAHATTALDVWRDSKGRYTFHSQGDTEVERYDPGIGSLTGFYNGKMAGGHQYECKRDVWRQIHMLYGVTQSEVFDALASGSPSPEPVDFRLRDYDNADPLGTSDYSFCGDYGP